MYTDMSIIHKIRVRIHTSDKEGAGTDGNVYLGIGGREFLIDSEKDDFERGSDRTYSLSTYPADSGDVVVKNRGDNNPLAPLQIHGNDLDKFPVYIRFDPKDSNDHWIVQFVRVFVLSEEPTITYGNLGPDNASHPMYLKLGTNCGKWLFLERIVDRGPT